MSPEKYNLLYFFRGLIQLSIKFPGGPGWGHACSELLDSLILKQTHFIDRIMNDKTGNFHEYRLNGAGLKFHWRVVRKNVYLTNPLAKASDDCGPVETAKFQCYISGDQKYEYEDFVVVAQVYINERGCNHNEDILSKMQERRNNN
jgi:hypothetical protein